MNLLALMQMLSALAKEHRKHVMTLPELARLSGESQAAVGMALLRAEKKKVVSRVGTLWLNRLDPPAQEEIAFSLASPSYVSFESALYRRGILSQSPRGALTVAVLGRPKLLTTPMGAIRFIHLKPELFFGFDANRVAYPEKAWLDLLYLRIRKGEKVTETVYRNDLNPKRLKAFAKHFPAAVRHAS